VHSRPSEGEAREGRTSVPQSCPAGLEEGKGQESSGPSDFGQGGDECSAG